MLPFHDPIAATAERVAMARKEKAAMKERRASLDSKRHFDIDFADDDDDGDVDEDPEMAAFEAVSDAIDETRVVLLLLSAKSHRSKLVHETIHYAYEVRYR